MRRGILGVVPPSEKLRESLLRLFLKPDKNHSGCRLNLSCSTRDFDNRVLLTDSSVTAGTFFAFPYRPTE